MTSAPPQTSPTIERLEDQIGWYDRKSGVNQRWYKRLKFVVMISAVLVPVSATVTSTWGRPFAAGLGILIAAAEGLQQLNQYQSNWLSYRSTCEALRHEKYLFLGLAGPYAAAAKPESLLAERVEALVSQEHAKWVSAQEASKKPSDRTAL